MFGGGAAAAAVPRHEVREEVMNARSHDRTTERPLDRSTARLLGARGQAGHSKSRRAKTSYLHLHECDQHLLNKNIVIVKYKHPKQRVRIACFKCIILITLEL